MKNDRLCREFILNSDFLILNFSAPCLSVSVVSLWFRGGRGAAGSQPLDSVENTLGDFGLGRFGHVHNFGGGDDGDGVAVGIHADPGLRDVVGDDGVQAFRHQLLARVFQHVFGLGGEADHDLVVLARA